MSAPSWEKVTRENYEALVAEIARMRAVHTEEQGRGADRLRAAIADREALERRVDAFRACAWDHLIHVNDDSGVTASGYGPTDIPDELLIDAIVDESAEAVRRGARVEALKRELRDDDDYLRFAIEVLEAAAPNRLVDEGHYANRALTYLHEIKRRRAVLAGGEAAAEECHICHRPRDQAGEWYCSAAHPLRGEAVGQGEEES